MGSPRTPGKVYNGCQKIAKWLQNNDKKTFLWEDLPPHLKDPHVPRKARMYGYMIKIGANNKSKAIWKMSSRVEVE
jgi:hypothetical protein